MIGKEVKINVNHFGQQGLTGIVTKVDKDSGECLVETMTPNVLREAHWYSNEEIEPIAEIPEFEFEKIAQMAEAEGTVAKDTIEPFWEKAEKVTMVNDFIKDKPVDPDDAYARRKSTLEHLNGWCSDINKTNTSNMRPELRCLYNEAQAIMRTIAKEEEKDLCAGE